MVRPRRTGRLRAPFALALAAAACAPPAAEPPAADGRHDRICSVTIATDEMLAALVPPERVVGVTYMVDDATTSNVAGHYPPTVKRVDADLEIILSTEPDLVLVASYTEKSVLDALDRVDVTVVQSKFNDTFDEIRASLRALGRLVDAEERAEAVVAEMDARLAALAARLAGIRERPRVLFWARGWTAGAHTNVDEMIVHAGAINAAAEMGVRGHPAIPLERVLLADPDILLVPDWSVSYGTEPRDFPEVLRSLRAVREGRVIAVPGRIISTVSQYVVDGTEWLARRLHPEAFAAEGPG